MPTDYKDTILEEIHKAEAAMSEPTESVETTDISDVEATTEEETTPAQEEVSPSASTETVDATKPVDTKEPVKASPDLLKILESEGVKPRKDGKFNSIPHPRVVKIAENAAKKMNEAVILERDDFKQKFEASTQELEPYKATDELILSDPDRYVGMLALMHPKLYGKFVATGRSEPTTPEKETKRPVSGNVGTRPAPDHKFEDGSMGYTPEQHEKLLEWVADSARVAAVAEAEERLGKRLGPLEDRYKADQSAKDAMPEIRRQFKEAHELYGDLFDQDYKLADQGKSEVLNAMRANKAARQPYLDKQMIPPMAALTFEAACAKILLPKIKASGKADRDKMREELTAELNGRKAAAVTGPAASTQAPASKGKETTADVTRAALRSAGLIK